MSFSGLRRGERKKNAEKMYSSIAADKLTDKFGTIIKKHLPHQRGQRSSRPAKKLKIDVVDMDNESDPNDGKFVSDESSSESEDGDTEIWWGRRAQFPNLYRLARDILAIPGEYFFHFFPSYVKLRIILGSAVAVEHICSGGRDTSSMRRASLLHHPYVDVS